MAGFKEKLDEQRRRPLKSFEDWKKDQVKFMITGLVMMLFALWMSFFFWEGYWRLFAVLSLGVIVLSVPGKKRYDKILKKNQERIKEFTQETEKKLAKEREQLKKVDEITAIFVAIENLKVVDVSGLKELIREKEKEIAGKEGNEKIYQFLKVDTFLQDFRKEIRDNMQSIAAYDEEELKAMVKEGEKEKKDVGVIADEVLNDVMSGRPTAGIKEALGEAELEARPIDEKLEEQLQLANFLKTGVENKITSLDFYNSISVAMVMFYLDDKKVNFFEIYDAFEKLGVFNSTWQKEVAENLESIDSRLEQINSTLAAMNGNFERIAQNTSRIADELRQGMENIDYRLAVSNNLQRTGNAMQRVVHPELRGPGGWAGTMLQK